MYTYSNAKISQEYNVSKTTVTRWIELAMEGKNNLQLNKSDEKVQIVYSLHNKSELSKLAEQGKKYRSHISTKKYSPERSFYEIFSEEQIIDIYSSLKLKKDLPFKYTYKFAGPPDKTKQKDAGLNITKTLLENSLPNIIYGLNTLKVANIVDLGMGKDSLLYNNFLTILKKQIDFGNFLNINLTPETKAHEIADLQAMSIGFENYLQYDKDIEISKFTKNLFQNTKDKESNLIFSLDEALNSLSSSAFWNIASSMSSQDILIFSLNLDNSENRVTFDKYNENSALVNKFINAVGIDENLCEYRYLFDSEKEVKIVSLKLDKDYEIEFELFGKKNSLNLFSREELILHKEKLYSLQNILEIVDNTGLEILSLSSDNKGSKALVICKLKK